MLEQQLRILYDRFEFALATKNWDVITQLDSKLQTYIPVINQKQLSEATKYQLHQLHSLYNTMIVEGEKEKLIVKQRLNQQTGNQEGMHAYLQVQK